MASSSRIDKAFLKTTNSDYGAFPNQQVIKMDDLIKRRDALRKPSTQISKIDNTDYVMTNTCIRELEDTATERVLSAHIIPKKFPVDPDRMVYPPLPRNPLYYTTSTQYGNEVPKSHQVAEAFFPKTNKFTKSYTDSKPRTCGLNTVMDKEFAPKPQ